MRSVNGLFISSAYFQGRIFFTHNVSSFIFLIACAPDRVASNSCKIPFLFVKRQMFAHRSLRGHCSSVKHTLNLYRFSRQQSDNIFLIFPSLHNLTFHTYRLPSRLFARIVGCYFLEKKNRKTVISLSFAEFAHSMVRVKTLAVHYSYT